MGALCSLIIVLLCDETDGSFFVTQTFLSGRAALKREKHICYQLPEDTSNCPSQQG